MSENNRRYGKKSNDYEFKDIKQIIDVLQDCCKKYQTIRISLVLNRNLKLLKKASLNSQHIKTLKKAVEYVFKNLKEEKDIQSISMVFNALIKFGKGLEVLKSIDSKILTNAAEFVFENLEKKNIQSISMVFNALSKFDIGLEVLNSINFKTLKNVAEFVFKNSEKEENIRSISMVFSVLCYLKKDIIENIIKELNIGEIIGLVRNNLNKENINYTISFFDPLIKIYFVNEKKDNIENEKKENVKNLFNIIINSLKEKDKTNNLLNVNNLGNLTKLTLNNDLFYLYYFNIFKENELELDKDIINNIATSVSNDILSSLEENFKNKFEITKIEKTPEISITIKDNKNNNITLKYIHDIDIVTRLDEQNYLIELDGSFHFINKEQTIKDINTQFRDEILEKYSKENNNNIQYISVSAKEINKCFDNKCCENLKEFIKNHKQNKLRFEQNVNKLNELKQQSKKTNSSSMEIENEAIEMYKEGQYYEKREINIDKAIECYKKSAKNGYNSANYKLGYCNSILKKFNEAIEYYLIYLKNIGENIDCGACFNLACCYRENKQFDKAIEYYKKSAENNYEKEECNFNIEHLSKEQTNSKMEEENNEQIKKIKKTKKITEKETNRMEEDKKQEVKENNNDKTMEIILDNNANNNNNNKTMEIILDNNANNNDNNKTTKNSNNNEIINNTSDSLKENSPSSIEDSSNSKMEIEPNNNTSEDKIGELKKVYVDFIQKSKEYKDIKNKIILLLKNQRLMIAFFSEDIIKCKEGLESKYYELIKFLIDSADIINDVVLEKQENKEKFKENLEILMENHDNFFESYIKLCEKLKTIKINEKDINDLKTLSNNLENALDGINEILDEKVDERKIEKR